MRPGKHSRKLPLESLALACAGMVSSFDPAWAEDTDPTRDTLRIEVTGTRIPRSDVESALPVQVIRREDIERGGFASVAEIMSQISANIGAFSDALSIGAQFNPRDIVPRPGLSSINLRGIGDGSTLVLVNGRRVANYAFDGGAVDVNTLPIAAIDRVEILKDGASAIYGTDAIAGVVNFILRKDYRGADVSAYGDWTQHGGGNRYQASASAGYGDLATDRFNAFVTLDYQKDEALHPSDRSFAHRSPDDPLFGFSKWSMPANILTDNRTMLNPSYGSGCAPPLSLPVPFEGERWCGFDVNAFFDVLPRVTRTSVLGRATVQLNPEIQFFAEAAYAHNEFTLSIVPTSAGGFAGGEFFYPAGGPFYPAAFAAANGLSGDLSLIWRTLPLGRRINDVDTQALRALVGVEGTTGDWDYGAAIVYSENRQRDDLAGGYVSGSRLADALATGLVNPFGTSGPEGDALLAGTAISGDFHRAKGTTWLIDARASRDLVRMPGGALAIAVGAEARRERLANTYSPLANSGDVLGGGGERFSLAAGRDVEALFAETSIPFAASVESQVALRYDHYSDFGNTVNPKLALRWQPVKSLLLRTSWGTGFRAPTIYDLQTPLSHDFTAPELGDPVRCPVTQAPADCNGEFPMVVGGNPNLAPEKSEQFNAGVVLAPTPDVSLTLDYWKIRKKDIITGISENETLLPGARFAANVVRGPADPDHPDLPGPIVLVDLTNQNFGDLRTSGFDVSFSWRGPATPFGRFTLAANGTYVSTYEIAAGDETFRFTGNNDGPYVIPRWRHYASIYWSLGTWSATLAQSFQNGYDEFDLRFECGEEGCVRRRVGAYSTWDIQVQYTGLRNTTLAIGVKNLFDRDPPHTHSSAAGVGFDASYADPRGRSLYARIAYAFN